MFLSTRYDEGNWNRKTYKQEKRRYLLGLIEKYPDYKGQYIEGHDHIEFRYATHEMEQVLRKECESKGIVCDIWAFPKYSQNDIKNARYVRLSSGASYNETDCDADGVPFNFYKENYCDMCGIGDLNKIQSPFRISKRIFEDNRDISTESNGVTIFSEWVFKAIQGEIEPWIVWGYVEIVDKGKNEDIKKKYIWIRPKVRVGFYVDSKILKKCDKCGRPTEIRQQRSKNIFEADKQTVDSFRGVVAPIVLAGNWFGDILRGGIGRLHHDVFVSGKLYEKIRKMKLKALYKANYVIHAADEPYDWDPMKDWSVI